MPSVATDELYFRIVTALTLNPLQKREVNVPDGQLEGERNSEREIFLYWEKHCSI